MPALVLLLSCGSPGSAVLDGAAARLDPSVSVIPDCTVASACPDAVAGLDPARCLDDAALFDVTALDGVVIDVSPQRAALDALALEPGTWWAIWPDPDGACAVVVHTVEVQ